MVSSEDLLLPQRPGEQPEKLLSTGQGFALAMNYIIGTGILTLPFALHSAGSVFGCISLVVSIAFGYYCVGFTLESISRAEALQNPSTALPDYSIRSKLDFASVCSIIGGPRIRKLAEVSIVLYSYGALWSYASAFATSAVSVFDFYVFGVDCDIYAKTITPTCMRDYRYAVVVFALVVIPLALADIKEQVYVQVALTGYRFLVMFLMVLTVTIGLFSAPFGADQNFKPHGQSRPFVTPDMPLWDFQGYKIFTTAAVALCLQFNIPDIINSIEDRSKANLRRIFNMTWCSAAVCYFLLSLLCALFFGSATESLITLNWRDYNGNWLHGTSPNFLGTTVKLIVQLLPVLDMISVFPLLSITLANNLFSSLPEHLFRTNFVPSALNRRYICRLLSCCPPISLALFFGKLDQIFVFTGLVCFVLSMALPCILVQLSIRSCSRLWRDPETGCSIPCPHEWFYPRCWTISLSNASLIFSISCFVLAFIDAIRDSL